MKKCELKDFDLVTLRNGDNYFKWGDLFIATEGPSIIDGILMSFKDDLTFVSGEDLDIMRVKRFCPPNSAGVLVTNLHYFMRNMLLPRPDLAMYMKVIWERKPEVMEVTIDEIAKKFGVPVENLKIKK